MAAPVSLRPFFFPSHLLMVQNLVGILTVANYTCGGRLTFIGGKSCGGNYGQPQRVSRILTMYTKFGRSLVIPRIKVRFFTFGSLDREGPLFLDLTEDGAIPETIPSNDD